MSILQTLRNARVLARVVLCWFVFSIGLAVAAPIVQPQSMELVCSASGTMKLVSSSDDDSTNANIHTLQCVMCMALDAPPAAPDNTLRQSALPGFTKPALISVHATVRTASPLAARGPPASV